MLKFSDCTISIGGKQILTQITQSFPYGTITAILGPNGSGKSSLLKSIFSPLLLSSGTVLLDDIPLTHYSIKARAQRISYLPQMVQVPAITVEGLVAQGRFPYTNVLGSLTTFDQIMINRALLDTDTLILKDRLLPSLSGGELKRAYLAMILAQNTDYIILDEPTAHLDIRFQLELLILLQKLRDRGKTIIVVLHDMNEALSLADILVFLKDQTIARVMTKEEFLSSNTMEEIFQVHMSYQQTNTETLTSFRLNSP